MASKKKSVSKAKGNHSIQINTNKKKLGPINKPLTGSQLYQAISEETGLPRSMVKEVFDSLRDSIIPRHLKNGPSVFILPRTFKIKVIRKPATKAREGINPFTKEKTM